MLNAIVLSVIMLNVIVLSVIMLNVIVLSVIMMNVFLLSVISISVITVNVTVLTDILLNVILLKVIVPLEHMLISHGNFITPIFIISINQLPVSATRWQHKSQICFEILFNEKSQNYY
jgi:hypothetical protein